ncbi:glycoside hydrolase family 10 protein [Aaosphaeria arxii CBS 175.79]|uniref:Beta-xylanase n=1 Tax=Aaosphaeria arxii CBS 175.79 TaxID=1450172 RepID=A0A6A5Y4U7_9PLEO|nr:glycoside hydrolase family 10 protein [Aaosphaeria arxii CBS 175.79]KAF2020582.1 glycoside hydrolase family 10 protein [Aaosphaeria arxii CBS 175.79]
MKLSIFAAVLAALPLATSSPTWGPGKGPYGPKDKYPGLAVLAKRAGLQYFGTAIDNVVLNNTRYVSIAHNRSEFDQVTPANGQKFVHIEPQRGVFNWTLANQVIKPAKKARQSVRCHNFIWHTQAPEWLEFGNWTKKELVSIMENHIKVEARYFYDTCFSWDVVNESFNDDGTFRETFWYKTLGKEYIELAFKFARKYTSPRTTLYYNDYGIEKVNNKSLAIAELVKDFIKRDIPIDGVGLQGHFRMATAPKYEEISASIAQFNKLGVETAITELDVRIELPDSPEKKAKQAEGYANAVKACVDADDCVGVTVWDFWDPVSWVPYTFPGWGNACLLDDDFNKKPAYYAVSDVLRAAA